MATTLRIAAFTLAMAANTILTHHLWRAPAVAARDAESTAATAPAPWAAAGFRDEERCTMLSAPPECD